MGNFYTSTDHFALMPALVLALFGCAGLFFRRISGVAMLLAGELFTGIALWRQLQVGAFTAFGGGLTIDGLGLFFNFLFVAAAVVTGLISYRYLDIEEEHHPEFYGLLMLAQCGMFFLATGTELVTLFTGMELMSVTFYVLVGFLRESKRSNEAALKYLLLGAFSSGILAYGLSLFYGLTGTTKLTPMAQALAALDPGHPAVLLALATTAAGLFFKIAAAPFHMWAPDAYEGAPTPVTAYLSVASKAAAFALLLRLFLGPLAPLRDTWQPVVMVVAILSLTIGNLAAVTQSNIKRLLAYSSISHAGYILLGIAAGNETGLRGALLYTLVYTFMNLGAFLVLVALRRRNLPSETLEDFAGLMRYSPVYAVLMLVFLLSLAGIPPTAGFVAKAYLFLALVEAQQYVLAVIGTVYVAVSLYYYFRIVRVMFAGEAKEQAPLEISWGVGVSTALTALATLGLGLWPEPLFQWVKGVAR
ncbi:MAG: NADH-quinone oxidoreductase subunit N [Acidobacteria bacterium]|nr:NADH-quinone oxidoreductase subunit N [Acidobacteriota bacterium]